MGKVDVFADRVGESYISLVVMFIPESKLISCQPRSCDAVKATQRALRALLDADWLGLELGSFNPL
jgi:hypothetical protein